MIEPHYPKAGNGRPPIGLERMLRIHFLQHWFNLSDQACEEALYDSCEPAPLRRHRPGPRAGARRHHDAEVPPPAGAARARQAICSPSRRVCTSSGLTLKAGTIVDATIIAAPSSTKNADKQRDPEMHQTRKGKQWYFGMKLHIGVDSQSGLAHSAVVTAANVHDKHPLPELLHGDEKRVYGDSAYSGQKEHRSQARRRRPRTSPTSACAIAGGVDEAERAKNRNKSPIRARVEHLFLRRQAAVGLCQGALPRPGQERQPRLHCAGLGQHLPRDEKNAGIGTRVATPRHRKPFPPSSKRTPRRNARLRPPREQWDGRPHPQRHRCAKVEVSSTT